MAASPICTVKDGAGAPQATTSGVNVTAGNLITIQLVSLAGADIWTCVVYGQDELVTPPTLAINTSTKTATFTAPAGPWSLLFKSTAQSQGDPTLFSTTFKVCVLTSDGVRLGATNETTENDPTFGSLALFNKRLRTPGSGASTPTGTGLPHVVAGVQNGAASLIVNADVDPAAAIAGTKLVPTFGAQAVTGSSYDINAAGVLTIGGVATGVKVRVSGTDELTFGSTGCNFASGYTLAFGTSTAGTGYIRFPTGANQLMSFLTSLSANGNVLSIGASDALNIGDASGVNGNTRLFGLNIFISPASGGVVHFQGNNLGVEWMNIDATAIHGTLPFAGDASSNKPYQLLPRTIATAATITLAAADYQCPILIFTGSTTSAVTFPANASGWWQVVNQSSAVLTLKVGTGATTITVAAGKSQICSNDGANAMVPYGGNF